MLVDYEYIFDIIAGIDVTFSDGDDETKIELSYDSHSCEIFFRYCQGKTFFGFFIWNGVFLSCDRSSLSGMSTCVLEGSVLRSYNIHTDIAVGMDVVNGISLTGFEKVPL